MVTDLWHVSAKIDTPRLHSLRWHDTMGIPQVRNNNCCVNIHNDCSTSDKNLVNFGPVINLRDLLVTLKVVYGVHIGKNAHCNGHSPSGSSKVSL